MKSESTNLTTSPRSECEPKINHGGSKSFDVATSTRDVYPDVTTSTHSVCRGADKEMPDAYCWLGKSLKSLSVSQYRQEACARESVSRSVAEKMSIDIVYLLRMDDDLENSENEDDDDLFSVDSIRVTVERRKRTTGSSKETVFSNSPKNE